MKKQFGFTAGLCVVFAGLCCAVSSPAAAQDQTTGAAPPPNVLVIMREFLKPGKAGSVHEKSESAFVQAMNDAKEPEHYIAMNSLSGRSRALFFLGYDSFADWQKDMDAMQKNPTLASAFDQAQEADGKLLQRFDSSVFVYQPDKSFGAPINIGAMKYVEITLITIRPGHNQDWDELAKLHDSIYSKAPNAGWAMYAKRFGEASGGRYIVLHAMRSLAELDETRAANKKIWASVSADQKKKGEDLEASCFESIETNLFAFSPKMSYVSDKWRNADPDFWGKQ
ncbi:MAG: hypothetical protein ACYCOR_15895 [Acidobacteriaceae bacterium]